jgi:WD40 repeat protein
MFIMGFALFFLLGIEQGVSVATDSMVANSAVEIVQVVPQPTVIAQRVLDASISPDGKQLAIVVWNEGQARLMLNQLQVTQNLISETRFTSDQVSYESKISFDSSGNRLLIASADMNKITVLSTLTGDVLLDRSGQAAAFLPDGSLIISDEALLKYSDNNIEVLRKLPETTFTNPYRMVASPDGGHVALVWAAAQGSLVQVYDTGNWNATPASYSYDSYIQDLAFHPAGQHLAITLENGGLVLDLQGGGTRAYNFDDRGTARAITFAPAGDMLVIASGDASSGLPSRIYAVRWSESDLIPPFEDFFFPNVIGAHDHDVNALAFTADGLLLSAGSDGSVRLWDIQEPRELSRLQI